MNEPVNTPWLILRDNYAKYINTPLLTKTIQLIRANPAAKNKRNFTEWRIEVLITEAEVRIRCIIWSGKPELTAQFGTRESAL